MCFQEAPPGKKPALQKNAAEKPNVQSAHGANRDEYWMNSIFQMFLEAFDALPVLLPQDVSVFSMDLSGSGRCLCVHKLAIFDGNKSEEKNQ